jgi:hypothetical protein
VIGPRKHTWPVSTTGVPSSISPFIPLPGAGLGVRASSSVRRRHCGLRRSGPSVCSSATARANWHYLTLPWTASCARAIWSGYASSEPTANVPTPLDPSISIVRGWAAEIGLNPAAYGTLRSAARRRRWSIVGTKSLRAVQLLLAYSKLESTVRYLGIEVDDALEMAEQTEV